MSAVIGALRVSLSIDTAAWESGLKGVRASMARAGQQMQAAGKKMSLYISTPLLAAAAAVGAAFQSLAGQAREVTNAAQVSGTTTDKMQKLAHASKSVGIETDKLGDIFKDTNDKIGDFAQTGGGPMADFFENIAPKVGITADAFKNLSGPEALQLYYDSLVKAGVSHADMIFYMEAIASDASLLIPLLKNGGQAFRELGEGAAVMSETDLSALQAWNAALSQVQSAVQQLVIALVSSGVVQWFADTAMAAGKWVSEFAKVNPEIVKWVAIIGGIAAAVGPVLFVLGTLTTIIAGISAPVLAAVAAFAALAAGAVLLYQNWDQFKQMFPGIAMVIQTVVESIKQYFLGLFEVCKQIFAGIDALIRGDFIGAFTAAQGAAQAWGEMLLNIIDTFIPGFKEGVLQVIQAVQDMGAQMLSVLQALPAQMMQIGREIIQGLINGIKSLASAAVDTIKGAASDMIAGVRGIFDSHSPSRVMHSIGNDVMQGLNNGMSEMEGDSTSIAENIGQTITSAFQGVIDGSKSVGDALKDLLKQLASTWANQAFQALFGEGGLNLGGGKSGGGIGGMLSGLFGSLFGFARGGSFKVGHGGSLGGIDSQLVAFRAKPRETVSITRPGDERASSGAANVSVNVINNAGADVRTQAQPDGSIDVIVDRMVAQKLSTRGTDTNNAFRQGFGASERLARR